MPKYHIERSIQINSPVDAVSNLTHDFGEWRTWSPWLCMEPEAEVEVYGTPGQSGHGYTWAGELVGEGEMQTRSVDGHIHTMDLNFLKPFRSKARVEIHLNAMTEHQTEVSWHMHGSLPFFMFFMINTMKAMIGMDYERGLKMLKEYAETGTINSHTTITGLVETQAATYIGLKAQTDMKDIQASMESTFKKVADVANSANLTNKSLPVGTLYDDMNIKTQQCRYTAMVPVTDATFSVNPATGTSIISLNEAKAIKVIHKGAYKHLGNSWATAMSYLRYKKLKTLKDHQPYELYISDPETTPEAELVTEIYIPVKN